MHENDVQSIFCHSYDPPKPGGEMANCDLFGVKIAKNSQKTPKIRFETIHKCMKMMSNQFFVTLVTPLNLGVKRRIMTFRGQNSQK